MEDKVVFSWELMASEFKQAIKKYRPEIADVDQFWQEYGGSILYCFKKGFAASMDMMDTDRLIVDAVETACSLELGDNVHQL